MSKVNQLYNMIQGDSGSSLSCTVIYTGTKGTEIFTGFLQEDPKVANQSTYNNSMPGFGGIFEKINNVVTQGANIAGNAMTALDGGGSVVNPLQTRNLWQGNEFNSFDVTITMYTLNEDTNLIQKAQKALELTSPTYASGILEAPGGYKYEAKKAFGKDHAQNTWSIRMGNHFQATHLACTGVRVTLSKESVRLGDPKDYNNLNQPTAPLYIQLNFSFITDRLRYSDETQAYIVQRQAGFSSIGNSSQASRSIAGSIINSSNAIKGWFGDIKQGATSLVKNITGGTNGNV